MHLVVVGGSGFIGSHFVDAAVRHGHTITIVGRSYSPPQQFGHLDYLAGGLRALSTATELLERADLVCHFASATTPTSSSLDPLLDVTGNLSETVQLLEAMRVVGNRRILYLSSGGAVYGQPQYLPIDERHPLNPVSSYGAVKAAIEHYLRIYELSYGFRVTVVRPANAYGPGQEISMHLGAVNTLLRSALKEETVTIWGDGTIVRDYIYISDLVALLLSSVEREVTGIFNCGAGIGTSLIDLLSAVELQTGRRLTKDFKQARPFDPSRVVLDISLSARTFDWLPKVSLEEGIALIMASRPR